MSASDYKELEARLRDGRWALSTPVEVEDDYNGDTYWSERREHSDDPIHAADAIADLRSRLAEAEKERERDLARHERIMRETLSEEGWQREARLLSAQRGWENASAACNKVAGERDSLRHGLERAVAENARLREAIEDLRMEWRHQLSVRNEYQDDAELDRLARAALGDSHEHGEGKPT